MFGKKHTKKPLAAALVCSALVLGTTSTALASYGAETPLPLMGGTAFSAQIVTVDAPVEDPFGAAEGTASADLTQANERTMPEYTVAQADALAKDKHALDKQLAKSKAVDAEEYLVTLAEDVSWSACHASTYGIGDGLMGSGCADGTKVTAQSMGVAHKTLPLGTEIQVMYDGKIVNAVVHDRGPYVAGRDLDLQPAVAWALGFDGVGEVRYRIIG